MAALRKQTGPTSGTKLNLEPHAVLVGPDNEGKARQAVRDLSVPGERSLEVVVDARLGLAWYLFGDPAVRPGFVSGVLDTDREPHAVADAGFTHAGIRWRVSASFGCAPYDPRAVVMNPGV